MMIPVSLLVRHLDLPPNVQAVYGTLADGRADLSGNYRITWHSRIGVFALPHLNTRFELQGADTRLSGALKTGFFGLALAETTGRAGPGLAQWVPGAWDCDITARLNDVGFVWGWRHAGASGVIETPQGRCEKSGRGISLPPLQVELGDADKDALISLSTQATPLAQIRVSRARRLGITIQRAAADVFPQLPKAGPITLQLPF